MIELLAITEAGAVPDPPVLAVPSDGVSVLCAPASTVEPDVDSLWRHEDLLERLMTERPLLPVRYGTRVPDEAAAAAAVAGRGAALMALLDHVRGAVELAVRVRAADAPDPPVTSSGAGYLRARTTRSQAADSVHAALAALARDSRTRVGVEPLRAAYLVDRHAVAGFVSRVRELQDAQPELAILCTGPWPPYSFAETGQ
ncbi:MAG TPA: GvpL/GvpF family gas vesicle protein [Solirubrobacteraceae bacterium]|nr:GvpL/GvpF family gas vesicle protein [Solirubrobacteraceae bacterium]